MDRSIFLGATPDQSPQNLSLKYANRHGLVAGATGTGKTVTLKILAEQFSEAGVPVFMADVKGDLSGLAAVGQGEDFLEKRAQLIGLTENSPKAFPTIFWDLYGENGHPIRTPLQGLGALLLSRLLDLSDAQGGVLTIAFKLAADQNLLLLDLKDLKEVIFLMERDSKTLSQTYGQLSKATLNSLLRKLLVLEEQGAQHFLGEPGLDVWDLIKTTSDGKGHINILSAEKLIQSPKLYSTFLMWLLTELFRILPEAGDQQKPKLVFFFDEAHLLFDGAPKILVDKIEQVVRLIRSKGVGVYFVTQSPTDIPENILGQLGNKVQHALRAFTPKAQKAVKVAAQSFRENPQLETKKMLTEMGVGEALVSTLEGKGTPSIVQHTFIRPPLSRLSPLDPSMKKSLIRQSIFSSKYDTRTERESAYEIIKKRLENEARAEKELEEQAPVEAKKSRGRPKQSLGETMLKSAARSFASKIGREIIKIILKSFKK